MHQHLGFEAYSSNTKAICKYPACVDVVKFGVLHWEKHEVGCATGCHAIMQRSQTNTHTSSRIQVFCQVVATRMAAKFAVVRSGRYFEAGIDTFTSLMFAWHRSEPVYIHSNEFEIWPWYVYRQITEPRTCYRHEIQFMHFHGPRSTLNLRICDLKSPKKCTLLFRNDTYNWPAKRATRLNVTSDLRRGVEIWESSRNAVTSICVLKTDHTQV